jgi:hypothetical protein
MLFLGEIRTVKFLMNETIYLSGCIATYLLRQIGENLSLNSLKDAISYLKC